MQKTTKTYSIKRQEQCKKQPKHMQLKDKSNAKLTNILSNQVVVAVAKERTLSLVHNKECCCHCRAQWKMSLSLLQNEPAQKQIMKNETESQAKHPNNLHLS